MHKLGTLIAALLLLLGSLAPAQAVNPDEVLDDPVLENRARDLSVEIRCVVCQNQSIDDSDADLARELRILVREKLVEGMSDQEILDFLVARYGEFVLLKPPFNTRTVILWVSPFVLLALGGGALFFAIRGRPKTAAVPAELSDEESRQITEMLKNEK